MLSVKELLEIFDTMRSGVYIVTTAYRGKKAGCTCVWVTRASFSPPLLVVNLAPARHTFQLIERSRRFCINVLGSSGLQLARTFGSVSGHESDKFAGVPSHPAKTGAPVLEQAVAYLDCRLASVVPVGDHRMVIGELIAAGVQQAEPPLIYDPESFYTSKIARQEDAELHGQQNQPG